MEIKRGMRDRIDKYFDLSRSFDVCMHVNGGGTYSYYCLGLDNDDKIISESYLVSSCHEKTPTNEIMLNLSDNNAKFIVDLSKVPSNVKKFVFVVRSNEEKPMSSISSLNVFFQYMNQSKITFNLIGNDFLKETAIVSVELYNKDNTWRFNAIARGFNGGIVELLNSFGGEKYQSAIKNAVKQVNLLSDSSSIQNQKSEKISLTKGQKISLTKKNNSDPIIVENGWKAIGKDYDLKALVRYRDGKTIYIGAANADECLSTPEGAVRHGGDVTEPGDLEHIYIKWHPSIASVAVSSYSAIENGVGSFYRYGVYVRIRNGKQTIEIPASNVSADDYSYTLCFGEILFGQNKDELDVIALEMYSAPKSENRIGYRNGKVVMDIGPSGAKKS